MNAERYEQLYRELNPGSNPSPMKTDLQTPRDSQQAEHAIRGMSNFSKFYAAPSPLSALNLAIADAVAAKQSDEFYRNLVAARDSLESHAALVAENKRLRDSLAWIAARLERGGKAAASDAMQQARAALSAPQS